MLTVFCPPGETSTWETHAVVNGNSKKISYAPRWHNGHLVIDVPRTFFISVILPSNQGKKWQDYNLEAMDWLGQNKGSLEINDAFPGRDRPPPSAATVTEAAPVMVRLIAPQGATSFSHEGVRHEVGKDGSITVEDHVADVLRSHGFIPA